MHEFTHSSYEIVIKKIYCLVYIHFTTLNTFLKTSSTLCFSLAFLVQKKIHVFCTIFIKHKSTAISTHNFYTRIMQQKTALKLLYTMPPVLEL